VKPRAIVTDTGDLAYALPTDATLMNYNSVILVGVLVLTTAWWLIHARKNYPGPKVMTMYIHDNEGHVVDAVPVALGVLEKTKKGE